MGKVIKLNTPNDSFNEAISILTSLCQKDLELINILILEQQLFCFLSFVAQAFAKVLTASFSLFKSFTSVPKELDLQILFFLCVLSSKL